MTPTQTPDGYFTGHQLSRQVTYCLRDAEQFGLMPGFVILGLAENTAVLYEGTCRSCLEPFSEDHKPAGDGLGESCSDRIENEAERMMEER